MSWRASVTWKRELMMEVVILNMQRNGLINSVVVVGVMMMMMMMMMTMLVMGNVVKCSA